MFVFEEFSSKSRNYVGAKGCGHSFKICAQPLRYLLYLTLLLFPCTPPPLSVPNMFYGPVFETIFSFTPLLLSEFSDDSLHVFNFNCRIPKAPCDFNFPCNDTFADLMSYVSTENFKNYLLQASKKYSSTPLNGDVEFEEVSGEVNTNVDDF